MNIDISYFDPSTMRPGAVVLLIGRRGSGKSTLAADIVSYQRHARRAVVVSATEKANPFWSKHFPKCFIHYNYSDNVTKQIFKMQKQCKKETGQVDDAIAIYDDVMFDKSFIRSKLTRKVFVSSFYVYLFVSPTNLLICLFQMNGR